MSQHDIYADVFTREFGIRSWVPAWRPGADLRLGMVGRVQHGEFVFAYHLKDRGIDLPAPSPPDARPDQYEWSTAGGVTLSVKAQGETDAAFKSIARAEGGIKLEFTKEDAMAIVYRDVVEQRLGDERAIGEAMVRSWSGGPWPKMQIGDIAITQAMVAGWGFAFGAASSGADVELKADLGVGPPPKSIGTIEGKVGVSLQRKTSFAALSVDGGMVVGYRGLELRQRGLILRETYAAPFPHAVAAPEEQVIVPADEIPMLANGGT